MQRIPEGSETATTAAAVVGPSLDELAREGARRMLVAALEAEVADYVARFGAARDERGHAEVMRNGHGRTRKVTVGAGTLEVRAPQVDDRRVVDGAKPSPDTVRAAVAQGGRSPGTAVPARAVARRLPAGTGRAARRGRGRARALGRPGQPRRHPAAQQPRRQPSTGSGGPDPVATTMAPRRPGRPRIIHQPSRRGARVSHRKRRQWPSSRRATAVYHATSRKALSRSPRLSRAPASCKNGLRS
jgi:hypothetical protein